MNCSFLFMTKFCLLPRLEGLSEQYDIIVINRVLNPYQFWARRDKAQQEEHSSKILANGELMTVSDSACTNAIINAKFLGSVGSGDCEARRAPGERDQRLDCIHERPDEERGAQLG